MDLEGTRRFQLSTRLLALIIPLITLLVVSIVWNLRQSQLIAQERERVKVAQRREADRLKAEADREESRRQKNAKWAASDARVQQLYREIDTLSRLNEQVLSRPKEKRSAPAKIDNPAATIAFP